MIRELLKRGLTQALRVNVKYIPYALALQQAGSKVILMEGGGGNGPGGDIPDGLHHLPADFKRDSGQPPRETYPCLLLLEGWQKKADALRATLRQFKEAGVTVDAAWLDWEFEPWPLKSEWRQASACSRCRAMFPPGVLDSYERYSAYIGRLRNNLLSTYVAAPILEVFPHCSVTNWELVASSTERLTASWGDMRRIPPSDLGLFNAANPVAYGNNLWYIYHWKADWKWPLDVKHMDRVYTQVMLKQISDHAANAQKLAPESYSIPWVDRCCSEADDPQEKIPLLSRECYREILRHIWLRGARGMQIFNAERPHHVNFMTEDVADSVSVYDEMLAFRPFLENGEVMNTISPSATDDGPIWSGLRLGDEAVVRTFTQNAKLVTLNFTPFTGGPTLTLDCPPSGATYLLKREKNKISMQRMKTAPQ